MEIRQVGSRGYLAIFEFQEYGVETTNIYVIDGQRHWFVIDTFLGPDAILRVKARLKLDRKPIIVANTHAHFDHFWGNGAFPSSIIVGHRLCRQAIGKREQLVQLERNAHLQQGKVEIIAPNVTFEKRLVFAEDGVVFFHSPGHTPDSISCLDQQDRVLFVGDNIGFPLPSIYPQVPVQAFIDTLKTYRSLDASTIVSSHYNEIERGVIEAHIEYLEKLLRGDAGEYDQGEYRLFHEWNKQMLARQGAPPPGERVSG